MTPIEVAQGEIRITAELIAKDLDLDPAHVLDSMRAGKLTAVCEQGFEEDAGRFRLTFSCSNRRLRLTIDEGGRILGRSATRIRTRSLVR